MKNSNANSEPETESNPVEAVVGIFSNHEDARRAAAAIHGPDLKVQRVSRVDAEAAGEMPQIVYEDIDHIDGNITVEGIVKGGAIGAGSGLFLIGIPGLNIAAPIAGAIVGAWIGGVAAIDEANREIKLPNEMDYRSMLAMGKSFVVVAGDEELRTELENQLKTLGAEQVNQHPPVGHALHVTTEKQGQHDV